jgi:hypothetical protein
VESTLHANDNFAEGATGWGHKDKMKFDGHLDPLKEGLLENRKFLIPRDADHILGVSYGSDWKTEKLPPRVIFCSRMMSLLFIPLFFVWLVLLAIVRGESPSAFVAFLCCACFRRLKTTLPL